MRKEIIVSFILLLLTLVAIWLFPIKRAIEIDNVDIDKYIYQNKVTIMCHGTNMTDTQFLVTKNWGIDTCPKHIKHLTGNTPEKFLKTQIDDYYDNVNFLLIGNFENSIENINESYVFNVDEWYPIEPIIRTSFIMWYPSYGFNIFEMKLK